MKYFFDTEFIEGFHSTGSRLFGSDRRRHHVDLISIGIVAEDGREYYEISSEYNYEEADEWVKENVIRPLYIKTVHGDARNHCDASNFHYHFGKPLKTIKAELLKFFDAKEWPRAGGLPSKWHVDSPEIYAYFADYDWVVFCSIFGRMIDLPEGMPMFCMDIKQMMEERGLTKEWKRQRFPDDDAHDALEDAKWNKRLYEEVIQVPFKQI